jgi:hypothetical protein
MSNNPFLKTNESSRFSSLVDSSDTSTKKSDFRDSAKNKNYDPSSNSFKQSYRRNRDSNYPFHKPKESKPIITLESFPDLIPTTTSTVLPNPEHSIKFKEILINITINDNDNNTPDKNKITPGWVEIKKVGKEIVYEYGKQTFSNIKQQYQEEQQDQKEQQDQEDLENDINFQMNEAIERMKECWDRYEREYDDLHGEGAYAEKFRLPLVYGIDYDTSSNDTESDSCSSDDE